MNTPANLEHTRSYLDVQLGNRKFRATVVPYGRTGPFITISRESGSGGSTLAEALATNLNARLAENETPWAVYDQQIVERVLADRGMSPRLARFLPEDKISELQASVGEIVGLHPNLWVLVQQTTELIRELARKGRVILVGRGSNFATAGIPDGLHARLVAPVEHRAQHMARLLAMTVHDAQSHNRTVDSARRDYVRSVYNADVADNSAYDLVINTGTIPITEAAAFVSACARKHLRIPATV